MRTPFGHEEVHLHDYLYVLKKRRMITIVFFFAVLGVGILFTMREKVLYRATATILIERENPNVVDFKEVMAFDASTTDYYQTQYQMIESRSLIKQLIKEKNLAEDTYLKTLQGGGLRKLMKQQGILNNLLGDYVTDPSLEDLFVRHMLRVRPVRNTRLVEVCVLHPNPNMSAMITNDLVQLFIRRNLEERFSISQRAMDLISGQLVDLKERVTQAEKKLQEYKESHGLINIPSIREKDEFIQDAKLELVKIQAEEAKLATRYLPAHPRLIHIRSQIEGLQKKIEEEEQKNLELSRIALEYSQLEREAESAKEIYKTLLARLQETTSEAQTQASNIMIVDAAEPPMRPFTPRPVLNILIALFIGSVGGVLLAFFIEYLDKTVRIPDDIEKGLGLDLLGIVPQAPKLRRGPAKGEIFFAPGQPSAASESFRALRTALLFRLRHVPGCRFLIVTSPNPGEGKTTVSVNLAAAFQQNHLKVLLIDADLRKPRLHKILAEERNKGVSDVLEGQLSLKDVIRQNVSDLGFDFLSCGSPSHHPTEILGSDAMDRMIEEIKQQYDIVLMDSAPFLAVADVAVLSEYAQGIIVTARYHQTHRRHLRDLKKRFQHHSIQVMGVVINHVSVREQDYYYHQYSYYGYGDGARPKKK
ncbi:MAG: polysaccharide biosynthesis tyrosine autokinase [Candidatus Omnitrophica bacterium]|nr:polysaccharide biosynthesis tyrosine autokinase [Candidatus Omnitrophota bacterium]